EQDRVAGGRRIERRLQVVAGIDRPRPRTALTSRQDRRTQQQSAQSDSSHRFTSRVGVEEAELPGQGKDETGSQSTFFCPVLKENKNASSCVSRQTTDRFCKFCTVDRESLMFGECRLETISCDRGQKGESDGRSGRNRAVFGHNHDTVTDEVPVAVGFLDAFFVDEPRTIA